jgi:hypothetical protein
MRGRQRGFSQAEMAGHLGRGERGGYWVFFDMFMVLLTFVSKIPNILRIFDFSSVLDESQVLHSPWSIFNSNPDE